MSSPFADSRNSSIAVAFCGANFRFPKIALFILLSTTLVADCSSVQGEGLSSYLFEDGLISTDCMLSSCMLDSNSPL